MINPTNRSKIARTTEDIRSALPKWICKKTRSPRHAQKMLFEAAAGQLQPAPRLPAPSCQPTSSPFGVGSLPWALLWKIEVFLPCLHLIAGYVKQEREYACEFFKALSTNEFCYTPKMEELMQCLRCSNNALRCSDNVLHFSYGALRCQNILQQTLNAWNDKLDQSSMPVYLRLPYWIDMHLTMNLNRLLGFYLRFLSPCLLPEVTAFSQKFFVGSQVVAIKLEELIEQCICFEKFDPKKIMELVTDEVSTVKSFVDAAEKVGIQMLAHLCVNPSRTALAAESLETMTVTLKPVSALMMKYVGIVQNKEQQAVYRKSALCLDLFCNFLLQKLEKYRSSHQAISC